MLSFGEIRSSAALERYIFEADKSLEALGYNEHGLRHALYVSERAGYILRESGRPEREIELGRIAGYLHDIGNLVNRVDHSQSGAVMAFRLLLELGMEPGEVALIVSAIGNHDEGNGVAVNEVAAALIIADKSDVNRARIRSINRSEFDIHDRVGFSVVGNELRVDRAAQTIELNLTYDTATSTVMEYFELFLGRMNMSSRAAKKLGLAFTLFINDQQMM